METHRSVIAECRYADLRRISIFYFPVSIFQFLISSFSFQSSSAVSTSGLGRRIISCSDAPAATIG